MKKSALRNILSVVSISILSLPVRFASASKGNVLDEVAVKKIGNPLGTDSPEAFIGKGINVIFGLVGTLALVMFVYGGISWMLAGGAAEKTKKAMGIIVWSVIGLAAIFLAYGLTYFLITKVQ